MTCHLLQNIFFGKLRDFLEKRLIFGILKCSFFREIMLPLKYAIRTIIAVSED